MSNGSCHRASRWTVIALVLFTLSISAHTQSDRKPAATASGNSPLKPRPSCTVQSLLFAVEGGRLQLGFHDNLRCRAEAFESRPDMLVLQLSSQGAAR